MLAYCLIKIAGALFMGKESRKELPSIPTVILTVLSCLQFIL